MMGCHLSMSMHQPAQNGHFCQHHQWSMLLCLWSFTNCCVFFLQSDARLLQCNALSGGEVYKCFFLCQGRLSRWSSLSLSSRTITSLGLTNAKVSVSSKSWCFASFCFVGILTTFNFATSVCEQHPTTNYIGHKTKRWQQTTQWCQLQTTAMICRISHPGDAEIPGTLRDISTFQLISI